MSTSTSSKEPEKDLAPAHAESAESTPKRKGIRWVPTLLCWLAILGTAGLVYLILTNYELVQEKFPVADGAVKTMVTVAGSTFASLLATCWLTLFSGLPGKLRLGIAALAILGAASPFMLLRFEKFDSNLIPQEIRWAWESPSELEMQLPEELNADSLAAKKVDFSDVLAYGFVEPDNRRQVEDPKPRNFPQFFGPNRTGAVSGPDLDSGWTEVEPKQLWKQSIGEGWSGFAAANGYAVTMEQRGENELVCCYDIDTGEIVWFHAEEQRHSHPLGGVGPRATPTIHKGNVYSIGANGTLLCLDGSNGEVVWKHEIFEIVNTNVDEQMELVTWGRSGSPLIYEEMVVVPGGGPKDGPFVSLIGFDLETGEEVWRAGDKQISYSSPAVANFKHGPQILTMTESGIAGFDPESGDEVWSYERYGASNGASHTAQPIPLLDGTIMMTKSYGQGAEAIQLMDDLKGGYRVEERWSNPRLMKTKFTSAVEFEGFAYGLSDGVLECVRIRTGESFWRDRRYGHGQVLLVGRSLLVLSEDGYLALCSTRREEFIEYTRFRPLEGITWNTLCLYGNKLLIRNAEEAGCWELPLLPKQDEEATDQMGTTTEGAAVDAGAQEAAAGEDD